MYHHSQYSHLKRVSYMKSSDGFEMVILLAIDRDLTEDEQWEFSKMTESAHNMVSEENIRRNPEKQKEAQNLKSELLNVFSSEAIFVEEIPNGYCGRYCCKHLPWFVITTKKGRLKIGWRKRVIHIEWTDSIIKPTANELFPGEDVTKYDKVIHAWGPEKAQEYINTLLKS